MGNYFVHCLVENYRGWIGYQWRPNPLTIHPANFQERKRDVNIFVCERSIIDYSRVSHQATEMCREKRPEANTQQ